MKRTHLTSAIAITTLIAASSFAQVQTFSNTVKYKESGIHDATGRSGSAAIETRALVNKDGSGDVDVTSGSFEGATSTGSIAKVQVKLTGPQTLNANNLDAPVATVHLGELYRLENVGVQASVRGVDGSRTDVVSATAAARLRPDLAVTSIAAPPHTAVGLPMNVQATVIERNGDSGARANCRLLANGQEIDRASGIWVDAGGRVACMFRYAFANAGDIALQVAVDAADPTDWDLSNNVSDAVPVHVYAHAESVAGSNFHAATHHDVTSQRSTSSLWDRSSVSDMTTDHYDYSAQIRGALNLNAVKLSTSAQTDGRTVYDYEDVSFPDGFRRFPWNGRTCGDGWSGVTQIQLCYTPNATSTGEGVTTLDVHHSVADAYYHSWGYDNTSTPWDPPVGVYDRTTAYQHITEPLGSTVQWEMTISDGSRLWHDSPFLSSLASGESHVDNPWRCGYSPRYGQVCSEYHSSSTWRQGYGSQANQ